MFTGAGIEGELIKALWAEAGNTAINLMNIQVTDKEQLTPYDKFTRRKELPKNSKNLKTFGEMGIILRSKRMRSKIHDQGQKAMMVGYGVQNGEGVYRMYKFDTKKITQTRYVRWINKMYINSDWSEINDSSESKNELEQDSEIKRRRIR